MQYFLGLSIISCYFHPNIRGSTQTDHRNDQCVSKILPESPPPSTDPDQPLSATEECIYSNLDLLDFSTYNQPIYMRAVAIPVLKAFGEIANCQDTYHLRDLYIARNMGPEKRIPPEVAPWPIWNESRPPALGTLVTVGRAAEWAVSEMSAQLFVLIQDQQRSAAFCMNFNAQNRWVPNNATLVWIGAAGTMPPYVPM
jgi:hypothetical protein